MKLTWVLAPLLMLPVLRAADTPPVVRSFAQTEYMFGAGDVADDVCVWIHRGDSGRSVILGSNKSGKRFGGLYVFQLDGSRWKDSKSWRKGVNWFSAGKMLNNVDLCRGFSAGPEAWDIVVAANRTDRAVDVFRVRTSGNGDFAGVELVGRIPIGTGFAEGTDAPYGMSVDLLTAARRCMAFISDKQGRVAQYDLRFDEKRPGQIAGVRCDDHGTPWQISETGGEIEGLVADAQRDVVYIASEKEGIFRYSLKDGLLDPSSKIVVDRVGPRLKADIEGLALYARADGTGYLLAPSQGSSQFAAYLRDFGGRTPNPHVGNFTIGEGNGIDAVSETDGIEAICADFGGPFRKGVFIAHDGEGRSNYKLVSWSAIAAVIKKPER